MYLTSLRNVGAEVANILKKKSTIYMKLYSPQGQQYYTADNNNKKEGKKTTTDNFTI